LGFGGPLWLQALKHQPDVNVGNGQLAEPRESIVAQAVPKLQSMFLVFPASLVGFVLLLRGFFKSDRTPRL
jgi:hypothetical protein